MSPLSHELRGLIKNRIDQASQREIIAVTAALCGAQVEVTPLEPMARGMARRFTVQGGTVWDGITGLTWTRNTLDGGRRKWAAAKTAAAECRVGGFTDWRLPTIQELLSIVDYSRSEPAIDTSAFECESAWYWSATPYASSPSDVAWGVSFGSGASDWDDQGLVGFVRAVRPGQIVGSLV